MRVIGVADTEKARNVACAEASMARRQHRYRDAVVAYRLVRGAMTTQMVSGWGLVGLRHRAFVSRLAVFARYTLPSRPFDSQQHN